MFPVSHSRNTPDCSACTQTQPLGCVRGRNCGGDVDVGNRGESSEGVTEGGQECEQGMLGNQQVLELCLCLNPSPR